jgi:hypothetical protein
MHSRSQAFWRGARRGSKFGAIAGIAIWLIIAVACVTMALLIPEFRKHALADLKDQSVLSAIGGFVGPVVLMVIYGAIPGAIFMGIAGVLHANRDEASDSN